MELASRSRRSHAEAALEVAGACSGLGEARPFTSAAVVAHSGALLVCDFVLEPLRRTTLLRGGWQHGPLSEARRASALEAARVYRAGAAAAAETAAAAGAATTWACAPPTRGGRRGHRPRRTSTRTSPACGGCTVRMLCRRRGREAASSRRCRGRHRRPAPRRASPALGLSITVIGSSRVATRPSISAYIALQYDTLNSSPTFLHPHFMPSSVQPRVRGVRSRKNGKRYDNNQTTMRPLPPHICIYFTLNIRLNHKHNLRARTREGWC